MYEEDIAYALTWVNKIQAMDKHTGVSLVEFSDDVNTKTNPSGLEPISFNSNIDRDLTALYDAWATSLNNLNKEKRFAINLVISDGGENNSNDYKQAERIDLIETSNVFNLVFASGFVSKSELNKLTQNKGIWFYQYTLIEADELIEKAEDFINNTSVYNLNNIDLTHFDELIVVLGKDTLTITN